MHVQHERLGLLFRTLALKTLPLKRKPCPLCHAGTVRAGKSINITINAKDEFGNQLTAGGETTWLVVLKTFPPLFEGQTSTGEVFDNDDGTYTGVFTPIMSGDLLLQVRIGRFPFSPRVNPTPPPLFE
jgi:hypothetical protein